jgi:surface antigen
MKPMKPMKIILLPVALAFLLVACADGQYGQKQTVGAVLGGVAGGLLGSKVGGGGGKLAATAFGTVLGGLLGSEVGKTLDKTDKLYAARVTNSALEKQPVGSTSGWKNPDSGNSGTVTPTRTYQADSGQHCREYQQSITVGGRTEKAYGTACRQPDGSWKVTN